MSRTVVVAAALVASLAGCPGSQVKPELTRPPETPPALLGKWASACFGVQNADGTDGFARTAFNVEPSTWALDLTFFADDACASQLGTIHIDGPWQLERPSAVLPGAFEARFDFGHRTVTPHVDGFIAFLQSMSCGAAPYAVGTGQDILAAGCPSLGFQPQASCGSDFDIVFANGSTLQFGQRPADNNMCSAEKRPTALGGPLNRVP